MSAPRLGKILRISGFTLLGVIVFLAAVAGALAWYIRSHQTEIRNIFVQEINRYLVEPVSVENIEVGLWKDFPQVSLEFSGLQALSHSDTDRETLFYAENVRLGFNLKDIARKQYVVREITVRGGDFNLKHYGNGQFNYEIWRKNPQKKDSTLHFRLSKVWLRNTLIRYRDIPLKHDYQIEARKVSADGLLHGQGQDFNLEGDVKLLLIKPSGVVLLADRKAKLDLSVANEKQGKNFRVHKGALKIEDLDLEVTGYVHYPKKEAWLDFDITGNRLKIAQLANMLPARVKKPLDAYAFAGRAGVRLNLKGNYTGGHLGVYSKFECSNGEITHKKTKIALKEVCLRGEFSNGKRRGREDMRLHLDTLNAHLPDNGHINGRLDINNFAMPEICYSGECEADLGYLQGFLGVLPQIEVSGLCHGKVDFRNRFPHFKPEKWEVRDFAKVRLSGYVDFNHLIFNGIEIHPLRVQLDPEILKTNQFNVLYAGQEAQVRIFAENVWDYFLFKARKPVYVNAELKSKDLRVEDWLTWAEGWKRNKVSDREKEVGSGGKEEKPRLWDNLFASIKIDLDRVVYENFVLNHVKCNFNYSPEAVSLRDLSFETFHGYVDGEVLLEKQRPASRLLAEGKVSGVDVNSCFKAFKDFNQGSVTHKNLGGNLTSDFKLKGTYGGDSVKSLNDIKLWADVHIKDGVLQGMESLKKISKFTGEDDLQDIHFNDLKTTVEIDSQRVLLHRLDVVSTAANLSLEGTHTFGNEMDYLVNIDLSELLSKRRAQRVKKNDDLGLVMPEKGGRIRLPLIIKGTFPDIKVKYAFNEAVKGAKQRIEEHQREVKQALEEEFSREPSGAKTPGAKSGEQNRTSDPGQNMNNTQNNFILEWEDE